MVWILAKNFMFMYTHIIYYMCVLFLFFSKAQKETKVHQKNERCFQKVFKKYLKVNSNSKIEPPLILWVAELPIPF